MSHTNKHGNLGFDQHMVAGTKFGTMVRTLGGTLTMDRDMPTALALDPGGAAREVHLPPEEEGLAFFIANAADAAEALTVMDDADAITVATLDQNEASWIICIGGIWYASVGPRT